ncbi:sensor domain-containing protein [Aquibacillus saliphilus]|uniref:sensor domain-containing protein n=1 Tax=Aquibacillus saliphilus TaxID=1909422 RepID=UPI001CEFCB0C|nr:EAL domain-containing protein [Aquibacillus saliphilus]
MRFNFLQSRKKKNKNKPANIIEVTNYNQHAFQELYDNHPDAVFRMDTKGQLLNYNNSVKSIFGYCDKDLVQDFTINFAEEFQSKRKESFEQALKGKAQNYQAIIFDKNGQPVDVDITYVPSINKEMQVTAVYGITKDITAHADVQKELTKVRTNLEIAQQIAKIGSWDYDFFTKQVYWSDQTFHLFGIEKKENFVPRYQDVFSFMHPDDHSRFQKIFDHAINNVIGYEIEYRIIRNGTIVHVYDRAEVIVDEDQKPVRIVGTLQDITRIKDIEQKLVDSEQRFKNIYDNLEAGIWSFDVVNQTFNLVSPGVQVVTGYTTEMFKDVTSYAAIIHEEDVTKYLQPQHKLANGESLYHQYRINHKEGHVVWVQDQTIPVLDSDGKLIRLDGIITNITEYKESEETIKHLAYHDYLTDLPNRRLFDQTVDTLIEVSSHSPNDQRFSIMYLDLDRFKTINDTLGHEIADKFLKQFGIRVKTILKENSLLARVGGDEFAIVVSNFDVDDYPVELAKNLITSLKDPFIIDGYELYITTSIGISNYPSDANTREKLIKNADAALYRAKDSGKNNYQIYSSSLDIESYKLYTIERDLRKSIVNDELRIYFQPKVDPITEKIVSAEALIRWEHPIWGLISPVEFIPVAEETGFILEIGDFVLGQVCTFINQWKQKSLPIVPISINVSAQRFLKNDLMETVTNTLDNSNVDPSLLEIEITESTLIQNDKSVRVVIQSLKEKGIKIALDDFGTGYSSLTYLKEYPIDTIKIDRSFIHNINKNRSDETIVKSIIYLAEGLDKKVVAEGVETLEQLEFLKLQHCHEIQGYLFSKPVPESDFQLLLEKGYLKPCESLSFDKPVRSLKDESIDLPYPISTTMSLATIRGRTMKLGKTEVLIEKIDHQGFIFLSTIHLPVRKDIILKFETKILNQDITMLGYIVWQQEKDDLYQYGISCITDETAQVNLKHLLNEYKVKLTNNLNLPDDNFVKENKLAYLLNKKVLE